MAYKVGDRVTLTCDVPIVSLKAQVVLRKGQHGTVTGDYSNDLTGVHFDAVGLTVLIGRNQMAHAVDELALLRAQLAARDKALDLVISFAKIVRVRENDEVKEWADELLALLTKHGVHPK